MTTLRFVVTGSGSTSQGPPSAGQLAAQRLLHTLHMIQGICILGIIVAIVGWIIDPYNNDPWFAMGFLCVYRGIMLLGYVGILPVMGKIKPPGGGMGRGSQAGSQLALASPNAAAMAAAAAFAAAGRSPRYQALQSPTGDAGGGDGNNIGSPLTSSSPRAANLWKIAVAHNSRRSPTVAPLSPQPGSARGISPASPLPGNNNGGNGINEGQITTLMISPRTQLSLPGTALATAVTSPRTPGANAMSPRITPRATSITANNRRQTANNSGGLGSMLSAAQLAAQVTNKRGSGAYRTSASLQSAASLSLNKDDGNGNNGSNGIGGAATPTAMTTTSNGSHHAHTTLARDRDHHHQPNQPPTHNNSHGTLHTPASSLGSNHGVFTHTLDIVTTPPLSSMPSPSPLTLPPERAASLTNVDIVTSPHHNALSTATQPSMFNGHPGGNVYSIGEADHDDGDNDGSSSSAAADNHRHTNVPSLALSITTDSPPRALRLGTFVDVRTLQP
jgi:hypothetical protein